MGRFYYGDIEGKFFFGCQSSDDANNYGVEYEEEYEDVCEYCHEHIDDCENDDTCTGDGDDVPEDGKHKFEKSLSSLNWKFDKDDKDNVLYYLNHSKQLVIMLSNNKKKTIESIKLLSKIAFEDDEEKQDNLWDQYGCDENNLEYLFARIYLGMRIYRCISKTGKCEFYTDDF